MFFRRSCWKSLVLVPVLFAALFPYVITETLLTNQGVKDAFLINTFNQINDFTTFPENDGLFLGGDLSGGFDSTSGFDVFAGGMHLLKKFTSNFYRLDVKGFIAFDQKSFVPDFPLSNNNNLRYTFSEYLFGYAGIEQFFFNRLIGIKTYLFFEKLKIEDPNSIQTYLEYKGPTGTPGTATYSPGGNITKYFFSRRLYDWESLKFYADAGIGGKVSFNARSLFNFASEGTSVPFAQGNFGIHLFKDCSLQAGYKYLGFTPGQHIGFVKINNLNFFGQPPGHEGLDVNFFETDLLGEFSFTEWKFRKISLYNQIYVFRLGLHYFSSSFFENVSKVPFALGFDLALSVRARKFLGLKRSIFEFGVSLNQADRMEYAPNSFNNLAIFYRMSLFLDVFK